MGQCAVCRPLMFACYCNTSFLSDGASGHDEQLYIIHCILGYNIHTTSTCRWVGGKKYRCLTLSVIASNIMDRIHSDVFDNLHLPHALPAVVRTSKIASKRSRCAGTNGMTRQRNFQRFTWKPSRIQFRRNHTRILILIDVCEQCHHCSLFLLLDFEFVVGVTESILTPSIAVLSRGGGGQ